jgi:hypothetical protein
MTNYSANQLLHATLNVLNRLPCQRVTGVTGFADTYTLASAIEQHFRHGTDAPAWELEIAWFGMKRTSTGYIIADTMDEVNASDVQLRLRFPDTGQIEVLLEREDLSPSEAASAFDKLEALFPQASHNIWPE